MPHASIVVRTGALAVMLGFAINGSAHAAVIGYTLDIFGNVNAPTFQLTNDSTTASITKFNFTIGDTSRNFDVVLNTDDDVDSDSSVISFTLNRPDTVNDAVRTDDIDIDFTGGFTPGQAFGFDGDVDLDGSSSPGSVEDFTTVFWNNSTDNSRILVAFNNSQLGLSWELPENPSPVPGSNFNNHYRFTQSREITDTIPEPSTLALFGTALLGLGGIGRHRKK